VSECVCVNMCRQIQSAGESGMYTCKHTHIFTKSNPKPETHLVF
jgi:hypothetical protein